MRTVHSSLLLWVFSFAVLLNEVEAGGCERRTVRAASEPLAQLEPSFQAEFLDLDLFPGASINLKYKYKVEPAHTNGLYARMDRWAFGVNVHPNWSNVIDLLTWAFGGGVRYRTEAQFIRNFRDPCDALGATPYGPQRMPINSRVARSDKFRLGDYFQLNSTMGFVVSADILQLLGANIGGVALNASYLVEGSYQAHLTRLDEKVVHLKVVARRARTASLGMHFGVAPNVFQVFEVSALDRQIRRLLNPRPIQMSFNDTHSSVFLMDYRLDLSDPEVARAFDRVLRRSRDIQSLKLAIPVQSDEELASGVILDIEPLEELYRVDRSNNRIGRIERYLNTTSVQDARGFNLTAGNKLLGFSFDDHNALAQITLLSPEDDKFFYMLKSLDRTLDARAAFEWWLHYDKWTFDLLFQANDSFTEVDTKSIAQTIEHKDNRLDRDEFERIQRMLVKALPAEVLNELPLHEWSQRPGQLMNNFGLRFQVVMGSSIVKDPPVESEQQVKEKYLAYLAEKGVTARDFFSGTRQSARVRFERELDKLAERMMKLADTTLSSEDRLRNLNALKHNELFIESGIGFLMYLDPIKDYRVDVNLSSDEDQLDFEVGELEKAWLYRQILTIKAAHNDDGYDLRREAEAHPR